jgi:hypothetical protein
LILKGTVGSGFKVFFLFDRTSGAVGEQFFGFIKT